MSGPGVWISCTKGKEKQAVGEVYQVFESVGVQVRHGMGCVLIVTAQIASDIWPETAPDGNRECDGADESDDAEGGEDFEAQVARELASIKRPRKEQRFGGWVLIPGVSWAQAESLKSELPDEHTMWYEKLP